MSDSHLLSTNSVRLVPMQLTFTYRTIGEVDFRGALALSPAAGAVPFSQAANFADRASRRNGFDFRNRTKKFEPHVRA